MKKKAWKSISAVFMAICMAITMSSTLLFMVVADALETQQESSMDSTEANTEETSSEESEEKVSTDYLKALNVRVNSTDDLVNLLSTSSEDRTYRTTLPTNKTYIYLGAELSDSAPEGSTITVHYYSNTLKKDTIKTLSSSGTTASSLPGLANKGKDSVTFKIVVGVKDNTQEYTVNISRTASIGTATFTDSDGKALVNMDGQYLVPKGTDSIKMNFECFGANLIINGESATSGEEYSFKPVFNDDDICEVNVKVYYDEDDATTITYNFKQYDSISGNCGENVNWTYKDGVLTISGEGSINNYAEYSKPPYNIFKDSIKSVVFESGVTGVGNYAFKDYKALENVTFSDTVNTIGQYAFSGAGLKSITIPNSITSYGNYAFSNCTELENATLNGEIGKYMFSGCSALKNITFSESITNIPTMAFQNCSALEKIVIPGNIKTIESSAFYNCTGIKIVEISEGLTSLGDYTFSGCSNLESISLPSTVTDIKGSQFADCKNLKEIKIAGSNYKVEDNIVYSADGTKLVLCPASYIGSFKVPNTVTEINDTAFYKCKNLTQVTLPESLTKIGENAFYGCEYLINITIPKNVTELGGYAFYGCTGLEDVVIHSDLTTIEMFTFSGCSSLKNINIPSTVKSIEQYAFRDCTSLTKIDLPNDLTSIGNYVFQNCSSLEDIQIPSSVTSLGNSCFQDCVALKHIEIPEGITSIPRNFLSNAKNLDSVVIPKSVTTINANAFASTNNSLKFIYYRGSEEEWNAIEGAGKPSNPTWSAVIVYNYSKVGDSADAPVIVEQPQDKLFAQNEDATNTLKVKIEAPKESDKIYISWYSNSKNSTEGGTKLESTIDEDGLTSYTTPSTETVGNKYYYCVIVKVTEDGTVTMTTSDTALVTVRMDTFSGNGTQKVPYLLSSVEDLQTLYNLVAQGTSMEGIYFKLTADITLPADWTPIGVLKEGATDAATGKNMLPFSGVLDGDNHTITVARGGQPLFGYVREATVKNLNIYGEYIAEEGLVANYVVDYGT
ncbi:MAG: leucine-rich repeat domain-containing protein, partial [Intestinibacter sp.]